MCVRVEYSGKGWDVAFRSWRMVGIEQEGKDGSGPYLDSEMDGEPGGEIEGEDGKEPTNIDGVVDGEKMEGEMVGGEEEKVEGGGG